MLVQLAQAFGLAEVGEARHIDRLNIKGSSEEIIDGSLSAWRAVFAFLAAGAVLLTHGFQSFQNPLKPAKNSE